MNRKLRVLGLAVVAAMVMSAMVSGGSMGPVW